MFSKSDIEQIRKKGMSVEQVNQQIAFFRHGIPLLNIDRPATIDDGITVTDNYKIKELISVYVNEIPSNNFVKFVPASGAATRMFKSLFEQLSKPKNAELSEEVAEFAVSLPLFAFYNDLVKKIEEYGDSVSKLIDAGDIQTLINYLLSEKGLNYGNLPKGLIKFHKYASGNRTSLEEHLIEGVSYAKNINNEVKIHFTVSPEHLNRFKLFIDSVIDKYSRQFDVKFLVELSLQKSYTDTIAVDENNNPFREKDKKLVFRPGGHGALLENLNDIDGDIVFIKNIDNVVPDHLKDITVKYKKVLAGMLLQTQKQVFLYLRILANISDDNNKHKEIKKFIEHRLGYKFSPSFDDKSTEEQKQILINVLNRPIRVCGMVKNTDQPGGGPFWVRGSQGELSLQILESSQFDFTNKYQKDVFNKATHFNPVDLVISLRNEKGQKFKLSQFLDPGTGFISVKSKDGRSLKAFELPGLWNGAMADWNTIFVEVPVETFNPVKTISDLLRKEHNNFLNL